MRLDKYLSNSGYGSRKEVKQLIRTGQVSVDGNKVSDPGFNVDENNMTVSAAGRRVHYQKHKYFMLNKPAGYVSATADRSELPVTGLLSESDRKNVFPVGRLDKDTTGLMLLTDDGELAHRLLSPKKHIPKEYQARLKSPVKDDDIRKFAGGLVVDNDFTALPAVLRRDETSTDNIVYVTITEGKYHQIKRMFAAVDNKVISLKRIRMGKLFLDNSLPEGHYRSLTPDELTQLI